MKLINISKIVLLSSILILGGCKLKNPTDDVKIKIDTAKLLPFTFSIQFVNQADGSSIKDKVVKIEISGKDADKIYELSGKKTFTVVNGFINLAIKSSSTPSEVNPLSFNITATADGYLATTVNLLYTEAESKTFDIPMVSLSNLPASINKTTTSIANGTDGLASDLTVTSAKVSTINTGMSITIPAGTKFLDASGNVLAGDFDVNVYYFSPESESLQYTPQSDENGDITVKYKNNQSATYLSIDAAVAYIEISKPNGIVTSFSKPAKITMDVHKDITNIETGADVKVGDSLEYISRTIAGPDWNFQKNAVVQDLGGSHFSAIGEFTNTFWVKASFGGKGRVLGKKASTTCTVKYKFTQSSTTCLSTFKLQNVVWRKSTGATILGWNAPSLAQNQIVTSTGVSYSKVIPTAIKNAHNPVLQTNAYNLRTSTLSSNIRTNPSPTCNSLGQPGLLATPLSYQIPAGQSCNPIILTVSINCPGLQVTTIPPIYWRVKGSTGNFNALVYTSNPNEGTYSVHGLTIGTTYIFQTTYAGKEISYEQQATGQTMDIEFNVDPADCP